MGLAVLVAMTSMPASVAQTTLLDVTIANPLYSDFEDGPQDWTANPGQDPNTRPAPNANWQWGTPTSGPGVAASGSKVWATNLSGNYTASECGGLMSPVIDLTSAASASIAFKHWRHFELSSATGTAWDAGTLMVTANNGATFTRVNATGYNTQTPGTTTRTCWDAAPTTVRGYTGPIGTALPPSNYSANSLDLSAFLGQQIRVVFAFGSDSSGHRAGWYLDDVATTIDGVTTTEDFEASNGGFTIVGTKVPGPVALGWSHGTPTTGPGNATAMWATNLNGNHGPNECHWIESPPVDLGPLPAEAGAVATATLSWLQWFRSSSSTAAGVVQIGTSEGNYTIVEPKGGYPASPTSTVLDACLHHLGPGLGAFAGLTDPVGGPMTEFQADITGFLGQNITVRFLFASTSSTATNPGWYVDDVNVEVALTASVPAIEDLGIGGNDAPLWTSGGNASSWAFGVATAGPTGETVYKTNLAGNYNPSECSWIETPSVPGALLALDASVKFDQWYRMESLTTNSTWDAGVVIASTDEGATWSYVELAAYDRPMTTTTIKNCVAQYGVAPTALVFSGNNSAAFETVVGDLSAYASAQNVKLRFLFGSDSSVQYDGWAIKNVEIAGLKVL